MAKAASLLDDFQAEQKQGFSLQGQKPNRKAIPQAQIQARGSEPEIDEDFDYEDDIKEELPDQALESIGKSDYVAGSMGIGVSQSMGIDPSVDSLALDEYDHVEYVERY